MEYLVVLDRLGFQREPCLVPAVGEDLEPLVEGGLLLLEQDVPALQEAEAALLRGGVVASGSGQDGPVQLVGDPLILQLPNVGAEGGALLLLVVDIAVVPGDPLFGGVDGVARVVPHFGGGQRDWVGRGWPWRRHGGSDLGVVDNTFCQALVVQGAGEVGGLAVAQVTWLLDRRRLTIPDHLAVVFGDHLGHVGHGAV